MSRVAPIPRGEAPGLEKLFSATEQMMGFMPNDVLIMAKMPQLPVALMQLVDCIMGGDLKDSAEKYASLIPESGEQGDGIPPDLIPLIAFASSLSAGCQYCQAHTAQQVHGSGATAEKLAEILTYEQSDSFSDSERAAVALAFAASRLPNEASESHFEALRIHFSDRQIVQIVAVIALFGFLNRWNDTLATQLETSPLEFAESNLAKDSWSPGKHR